MANKICTSKLSKELAKLRREPLPNAVIQPNENNIREWHFCLLGHKDSAFKGGIYHGKLVFPPEYPMKPPAIYMITPNGLFEVNVRICTSYSDYHPESWNPAWSCATIILGLQSFMLEDTPSAGCVRLCDATRRTLAAQSLDFNQSNSVYRRMFPPELLQALVEEAHQDLPEEERANVGANTNTNTAGAESELAFRGAANGCVIIAAVIAGSVALLLALS